jgi:F-type H+-transporting ATPase subunit epsilon
MFKLSIVTPEKPFYEAECRSVVVPGSEGYLGVLTDHAPLLTALVPGEIKVVEADGEREHYFAVSGGFFEVAHNHATVLADAIEEPGQIDLARAEAALQRARERLAERPAGLNQVRAELAVVRAKNRVVLARAAMDKK